MEIKVPSVGESVYEAEIGKWHKQDGDQVRKGDLLCELETEKVSLEVNADADGILSIKAKEGETVEVGGVIAVIEEEGEAEERKAEEEKEKKEEVRRKKEEEKKAEREQAEKEKKAAAEKGEEKEKEARRKKEEKEKAKKEKAGEEERRQAEERAAEAKRTEDRKAAKEERIVREPMSRIRRKIAERLLAARQQTAMLTSFNEADLGRVQELRRRHRESFEKKHGVRLGLMSFFVRACVEALREFPVVNARIDGDDIVYQNFYDIGIAVASERGLVVPVLRDADRLSFPEVEKKIAEFAEKVASNRIELADLEGGTFTITNGGVFGSLLSTPILNPPQSAILGMHAIQDRPVVRDGEIVVRPMMYLALSYDHRLIDGREAVSFLKRIREFIEEPEEMLLEG